VSTEGKAKAGAREILLRAIRQARADDTIGAHVKRFCQRGHRDGISKQQHAEVIRIILLEDALDELEFKDLR
jgi:hypothetical protein